MPDVRSPAAEWRPGVNAGYRAGRNTMQTTVCHYTVGRDSTGVGLQGYFHFLIGRDGTVKQFCEVDAVAWHAGDPWNARGPGIEVEYLDEPDIFTPESEAAAAALTQWLHSEWGVPLDFYDGPRVTAHNGFITHRSLIQTGDSHSDYWPYLPVPAMPAPHPLEEDMPIIIRDTSTPPRTLLVTDDEVYAVDQLTAPNVVCTKEQADYIINDVRARAAAAQKVKLEQ